MRLQRLLAPAALVATLALAVAPAFADPAADALKAKFGSAMAGVKSFKMQMSAPAGSQAASAMSGGTFTTTVVVPDRMAMSMDMHGMGFKLVRIGDDTYMQMNGGAWNKMSGAHGAGPMGAMMKQSDYKKYMNQGTMKVVPDEQFNGKTVGAFTSEADADKKTPPVICNYDKATYLLVRCHGDEVSILFTDYNSPTNIVDVPK